MWNIIDEYLTKVSLLINVDRKDLTLTRGKTTITPDNCKIDYLKPNMGYGPELSRYCVGSDKDTITSWGLYEFPSCCAFCVSTQAYVTPKFRGVGVNTLSNALRQQIAKNYGYSALICTDIESNVAERKTLIANGFSDIYQIKNKRTGNIVNISVKKL